MYSWLLSNLVWSLLRQMLLLPLDPLPHLLPSSSFRAKVSLVVVMDQFQLKCVDFGSHLDHFSDEMCQMNTRIGRIAHHQSRLGGFAPSPSHKLAKSSLNGGDVDDDDDASSSKTDDEMTAFQ